MSNWRDRFDKRVLPLRLIDMHATLSSRGGVCFVVPSDWNFHVISHTWSLEIRNLSNRIGKLVKGSGWREGGDTQEYNKAFAEANFSEEPCYEHLKIFLRALAADGVEKVWFDALTINQMDSEEKSREICHMGAYYCLSQGCYVSAHGIGEGYQALINGSEAGSDVPRWFTRVWTFQECILPRRLTFIVQKFDEETTRALEDLKQHDGYRKILEMLSHYAYGQTLATCFQKRVDQNYGGAEELCFMDEDEYSLVMSLLDTLKSAQGSANDMALFTALSAFDRRMGIGGYEFLPLEAWLGDNVFPAAQEAVGGRDGWSHTLQRSAAQEDGCPLFSPECVMEQVMNRECSVEEDRVLSVLGLLGLQGNHQLRTQQTLEVQLLALVKHWMETSPNLILNLCSVDSKPNPTTGFSWAPNLGYHGCLPGEEVRPYRPSFQSRLQGLLYLKFYAAKVVSLSPTGGVNILAKACAGNLVVTESKSSDGQKDYFEFWIEVGNVRLPAATSSQLISANSLELGFEKLQPPIPSERVDVSPDNDAYFHASKNFHNNDGILYGCIHLTAEGIGQSLASLEFDHRRMRVCKMWVVLLGYGDDGDGNPSGLVQKLLLCVRDKDDGEMHKIGTLLMLEKRYIDFSSTPFKECFIGGFGMDLGPFLAIGESLR